MIEDGTPDGSEPPPAEDLVPAGGPEPDPVDLPARTVDEPSGNGSPAPGRRARPRSAVHGTPTRKYVPPLPPGSRTKPRRRSEGTPRSDGNGSRAGVPTGGPGGPAAGATATSPGQGTPQFTAATIGALRHPWREHVFTRVVTLDALNTALPPRPSAGPSPDAVARQLELAWTAASDPAGIRPGPNRARMERAFGNVDEAAAGLLERLPEPQLRGQLPGLVAHVQAHLSPSHPQRVAVEALGSKRRPQSDALEEDERTVLVEAARTASAAARREHARLRSFCTIVKGSTALLLALAVVTAWLSVVQPTWIPLCSRPDATSVVCPTGSATGSDVTIAGTADAADVLVVMLIGLLGAAVTGAAAIRHIRGTSTPFAVPVALLLLKLPLGALTAVLGLLLLNGEFVPGLTALDTSGQILAWALLFGAAQQLLTGLVDKKAQTVLDSTGTTPMTAEKE